MRRLIFVLSCVGLFAGSALAYLSTASVPALSPAFPPATNPYVDGIYANGILESAQPTGENINVFPEVSGTVKDILVSEGQAVQAGQPLVIIDDSIQRATVEQLQAQAESSATLLEELRAQPRPEALAVAEAQLVSAEAALKTAHDTVGKQQSAYDRDARSVSKDALDNGLNAEATAKANVDVALRQRDLVRAGAWVYDIRNQERQAEALHKSYMAASALLAKYTLRAPRAGRVLAMNAAVGGYISAQGFYESYTQGMTPGLVLGSVDTHLHVRCYVDEILVPRLPRPSAMKAQMSIRGSTLKIPLRYVSTQPLVSPKIELSNQRLERVDLRVLPVIFELDQPEDLTLYPGQLVDVYIGE